MEFDQSASRMDEGNHSLIYEFAKNHIRLEGGNDGTCEQFNTILFFCATIEILFLIIVSNLFHFFLKRFGQPSTVSQMLAGFILGPTVLDHFNLLEKSNKQLEFCASTARTFFMFLVSLEVDISYLKHTIRQAAVIAAGSAIVCFPISIIFGLVLYHIIHSDGHKVMFSVTIFLVLFNTASPILIRVVNELKIAMTDMGRLAISVALVTDIACLIVLGFLGVSGGEQIKHVGGALAGVFTVMLVFATTITLRIGVKWVNKHYVHRVAVGDDVVFYLLLIVFTVSVVMEFLGYDPMIGVFVFGLFIPRDGPTARTIIEQLTYVVHNLLLPVYFGAAGLQVDIGMLRFKDVVLTTLAVTALGTIGKIGGTMAAAKYLGMPTSESLVLSFLLNIRGHVDLMVISLGKKFGVWNNRTYMALLISLFFNSITACPAITYIVRQDRQANQYMYNGLEWLEVENDLCILACIHSPNDIPTILTLIEISIGVNKQSLSPYIIHLMKLIGCTTTNMLYHQLRERDHDNEMGDNQVRQVNIAVDMFMKETDIHLSQLAAISRIETMHEDVQHAAQDTRASLVIVPFHRKCKLDGKMGAGKQYIRQFNINVLAHTPCSVGILVDRGLERKQGGGSISSEESMKIHVVVLFLGGADDREAAAYGGRLAVHPHVNVTFVRFKPKFVKGSGVYACGTSVSSESSSVLVGIEGEDVDEAFMANFYNRFVVTGSITYEERVVENPTELIKELQTMMRMYSLYIVGRTIQGPSSKLIEGMGDWAECPELGSIGDLLASSDFNLDGSVLVIQQYNGSTSNVPVNSL